MKLYHFTPAHLAERVIRNGITLGRLPVRLTDGRIFLLSNCQWLTSDGNFDSQSWATQQIVKYDRTAVRFKVVIPKTSRKNLASASEFAEVIKKQLPGPAHRIITDWQGSENWFLYFGRIPAGWIREVSEKAGCLEGGVVNE